MDATEPTGDLRARLRAALPAAIRARDRVATAALRSALAAIDDAEAVDPAAAGVSVVAHERIAGTVGGLGAGEVARAAVSEEEVRAVVEREIAERRHAAETYAAHGRETEAERLSAEADVLAAALADG